MDDFPSLWFVLWGISEKQKGFPEDGPGGLSECGPLAEDLAQSGEQGSEKTVVISGWEWIAMHATVYPRDTGAQTQETLKLFPGFLFLTQQIKSWINSGRTEEKSS